MFHQFFCIQAMPLNAFVFGIINMAFGRYAESPFANRKVGLDVLAKVANAGVVAFRGQIVTVGAKQDEIGLVAFNKIKIVCYLVQYFI